MNRIARIFSGLLDWFRGARISERDSAEMVESENRVLVVGLGNPGKEHRQNRHNVGFMAVERLSSAYGIAMGRVQNKAVVGDGRVASRRVIVAKPQTYMNRSGDAVGPLARYYRVAPENVLAIYDDIDLPPGTIRLREAGGSGGHNGMKSIIQHLGPGFPRLRLGVGRPHGKMPPAAYVLQDFDEDEEVLLEAMLDKAVQVVETFLQEGIDVAMSRHNGPVQEDLDRL